MKKFASLFFTLLRVAIGIGLLVYLGRSGVIEWGALLGLARAWPVTTLAFALLLVDIAVTAWRLCVLLRPLGFHLTVWASTRLMLIGLFFNSCLPGATGGDVIKIYYASAGNRGRRMEVATVILFDRVLGMLALMIWPLLAALFFVPLVSRLPVLQALLWGAGVVGLGILAALVVAFSEGLRRSAILGWIFDRLPFGRYAERIFDTVHEYRRHKGAVVAATLISLVAHSMSAGITLLAAYATHPEGAAWEMLALIPLGHLANVVPLTPGGLGVGEAAFNQLFAMAGLKGGAEALLGWRVLTLLCGLVGLAFYLQGRQQFVHATAQDAAGDDAPKNEGAAAPSAPGP
jgi:hypothetical protein